MSREINFRGIYIKTEYVKVDFANDKELAKAYSEMDLYTQSMSGNSFNKLYTIDCVHATWLKRINIYKKIAVKIDLLSEVESTLSKNGMGFDYEKDKDLVEAIKYGYPFIKVIAHTIAELTDDPRGE